MSATILIVEDELILANYLQGVLHEAGYIVTGCARSGAEAEASFARQAPHLVLMDIRLHGAMDGIQLAQRLRERYTFALVYLTAFGDDNMVQRAILSTPDAYLVKPVNDRTLLGTVAVVLHRCFPEHERLRLTEDLDFDPHNACLLYQGQCIDLCRHECQFLELLCRHPGQLVTYQRIENALGQHDSLSDGALKTLVWRLRKKIPCKGLIKTVAGMGYQLRPV